MVKRLTNELTADKIKELLDVFEVPYVESGKNVSPNYYGMSCPFCGDESDHLGIHRIKGFYTCWKCRAYGSFFDLLHEVAGISWEEYQEALGVEKVEEQSALSRINNLINPEGIEEEKKEENKLLLPKFVYPICRNTKSLLLRDFLIRRGYTIEECVRRRCYYGKGGDWTHRLVIPVYAEGKMVSYIGADMTGQSALKYKMSSTAINEYLYDLDYVVSDRIILTEGVFDCWRVGSDAVCSFGTHITKKQFNLIINEQFKELIMAWDGDAYWKAREAAKPFQPFIEKIKIVQFPKEHDPDSYGKRFGGDCIEDLFEQTDNL